MQAIKCEMCNSNDFVKEDGYFVCQHCGTKYTVEEAKKLMVEGTVKIDSSENVQKWFTVARRAKESDDIETAKKYYQMILDEEPNSWEAYFYSIYYDCKKIKNAEISSTSDRIRNSIQQAFKILDEFVSDKTEKENAINELREKTNEITSYLLIGSHAFEESLPYSYKQPLDSIKRNITLCNVFFDIGDYIYNYSKSNPDYKEIYCEQYKLAIGVSESQSEFHIWAANSSEGDLFGVYGLKTRAEQGAQRIKEVDPSYKTKPELNPAGYTTKTSSGGGCYVATAVYGSYNCPEVWTLRRYRDDTLAETWYGRAFIHTYYAISPTLVKWFGDTKWFKKMWQGKLDRMVKRLNDEGVENTPYEDKKW